MFICLLKEPLSAGRKVVYMVTVWPGMISPVCVWGGGGGGMETEKIGGGVWGWVMGGGAWM